VKLLLKITVPGVHTEQLGARNQPWDAQVRNCVRVALHNCDPTAPTQTCGVEARWFVGPSYYRRDIDNFRVKPVLDSLTAEGFWPDDNIEYVRRLLSEVELVASSQEERLEVTVYGL
jgi:hypothetical protein